MSSLLIETKEFKLHSKDSGIHQSILSEEVPSSALSDISVLGSMKVGQKMQGKSRMKRQWGTPTPSGQVRGDRQERGSSHGRL